MYRYRPTGSLFEFKELENLELYFASPQELNDPIEGMMEVIWQGDEIVWRNFLRHYLLCLEKMCAMALLFTDDKKEVKEYIAIDIPVRGTEDSLPTEAYKDIFTKIKQKFFALEVVEQTLDIFCYSQRSVRKSELSLALDMLNKPALKCIFEVYFKHNLYPDSGIVDMLNIDRTSNEYFTSYKNMINNDVFADQSELLFDISRKARQQVKLMTLLNVGEDKIYNKLGFLLYDFTDKYMSSLLELAYPKWYTTCFSESGTNAAMWASYADSHKGICLKFKTKTKENKLYLPLYKRTGIRGGKPIYDWTDWALEEVAYTNDYMLLDFFKSMLTLSTYDLYKNWYTDKENGSVSSCAEVFKLIEDESTGYRLKYWDIFRAITSSKSLDWKDEKEYRLVINNSFYDYSDAHSRVLKYRFEDLEGVIFGVRTSFEDKLRIIRTIYDLCQKHNRYNFDFFQAGYKGNSKEITIEKLGLLKFKGEATESLVGV